MVDAQRRITSVPLQFHFVQSKRSTTSLKDITYSTSTNVPPPKRPPPPLRVLHNTLVYRESFSPLRPDWTPVEIANFPPQLRRQDLLDLLDSYSFSPNFVYPSTPRFIRPFRITLLAVSAKEAQRMVMDLDGMTHSGREISVKMLGTTPNISAVQEIAHELNNNIINAARILYPNHAETILEVRELVKDGSHFAFLQKRSPVTIHSRPDAHALGAQGKASWEFVAGGAIVESSTGDEQYAPRLAALKDLLDNVERQGVAHKIWAKWNGSHTLVASAL